VGFDSPGIEMDAGAILLFQGVGIGSGLGDAIIRQGFLRCAEFFVSGVGFGVIGGLGNEPGNVPAGLFLGGADKFFHESAVLRAGELAVGWVAGAGLASIRFPLMPEDGAKTVWAVGIDSLHQVVVERAGAFPLVGAGGFDECIERGMDFDFFAFHEPLPDAGCAMACRSNGDGDFVFGSHCVAECGDEAAAGTVVVSAGLGVVGRCPFFAVEGDDEIGSGLLFFRAVVGGIGLAGDDEDLADADVIDCEAGERLCILRYAEIEAIPSAGGGEDCGFEIVGFGIDCDGLPIGGGRGGGMALKHAIDSEMALEQDRSGRAGLALEDLVIERGCQFDGVLVAALGACCKDEYENKWNDATHGISSRTRMHRSP
jgi:hypothetical protein